MTELDLKTMRIAAQQREWNTLQDTFKRLIANLEPLIALQIAAPRVQGFLPTFESYYPEAGWVKELLLTVIAYASAPSELPVHVLNQFPSPGCGNFLMSVFELAWTVQPGEEVFERYSHITNAVSNAILAELQHLYFRTHPNEYAALHEDNAWVRSKIQAKFWLDAEVAQRDTRRWLEITDDLEKMLEDVQK